MKTGEMVPFGGHNSGFGRIKKNDVNFYSMVIIKIIIHDL